MARSKVRMATPDDLPRIVEMARAFYIAKPRPWPFDPEATHRVLGALPFLSVSDGGFLAGTIVDNPVSPGWMVASEFLMWATDKTGVEHARRFQRWAKDAGAKEIRWSCPPGSRVETLYRRCGNLDEIVYSEAL